jgi:glycine betaine/choline ABC-type transport system substrate-binding protein
MTTGHFARRAGAYVVALAALALSACGSSGSSAADTAVASVTLTVVGLADNESRVLTEIYAQALEKSGFRVGRKDPVADLAAAYGSLKSGQADLFVTFTGALLAQTVAAEPAAAASTSTIKPATSVTTIVPPTSEAPTTTVAVVSEPTAPQSTVAGETTTTLGPPSSNGQATADRVTKQVNAIGEIIPSELVFGAPAPAQDKLTVYCSKPVATTNSLATFSDLAGAADHLTLGDTPDFEKGDQFGLAGFTKLYGASFQKVITLDPTKVVNAITNGDVDCGIVRTLDYTVTANMSTLEDDLGLATDEAIVPLMAGHSATPGATQIIDSVSKVLGTGDLREMMRRIEVDKQSPNIVAADWLQAVGIPAQ